MGVRVGHGQAPGAHLEIDEHRLREALVLDVPLAPGSTQLFLQDVSSLGQLADPIQLEPEHRERRVFDGAPASLAGQPVRLQQRVALHPLPAPAMLGRELGQRACLQIGIARSPGVLRGGFGMDGFDVGFRAEQLVGRDREVDLCEEVVVVAGLGERAFGAFTIALTLRVQVGQALQRPGAQRSRRQRVHHRLEQRASPSVVTGERVQIRRVEQAGGALLGFPGRSQRAGALGQLGGGRRRAARCGTRRRRLQPGRDDRVRTGGPQGEMTHALLGVADRAGEALVQRPPLARRCPLLGDRGHERMREAQPLAVALEHLRRKGLLEPTPRGDRIVGRSLDRARTRPSQRGDAAQNLTGITGQARHACCQQPPDVGRRRNARLRARELERRQRIATRRRVQAAQRWWRQPRARPVVHQALHRRGLQRPDGDLQRPALGE